MISVEQNGTYKLIETKANTKILYLDDQAYAWVEPKYIGDILVITYKAHRTDCVLATGSYKIYTVTDELYLSDNKHLELETGRGSWQGYLMLSGLPDKDRKRVRIIPTNEIITGNENFMTEKEASKHTLKL